MAYKIINKLSPDNLWCKFQQRSSQSNYATRHGKDLKIPRLNTELAKKSYQYSTVVETSVYLVLVDLKLPDHTKY